jgi:hypothetical protein
MLQTTFIPPFTSATTSSHKKNDDVVMENEDEEEENERVVDSETDLFVKEESVASVVESSDYHQDVSPLVNPSEPTSQLRRRRRSYEDLSS